MRLVIVLDCVDADALAAFWTVALGYHRTPFEPPYVRLTDPGERWPDLLLRAPAPGRRRAPRGDLSRPPVITSPAPWCRRTQGCRDRSDPGRGPARRKPGAGRRPRWVAGLGDPA